MLHAASRLEVSGDRRAAIAVVEELCRRDPSNVRGRVYLSFLCIKEHDYARALEAATGAFCLDSGQLELECLVNAGVSSRQLGNPQAARRYLERAVHLAPSDPDAQLELGRTLAQLREPEAAIEAFIRAIGEAHRVPNTIWLIEQALIALAKIDLSSPPNQQLRSLCDGARLLIAGELADAYRSFERARDGPCGLGMPAVRAAAETLLNDVWRQRAKRSPAPTTHRDGRWGECIDLPQPR